MDIIFIAFFAQLVIAYGLILFADFVAMQKQPVLRSFKKSHAPQMSLSIVKKDEWKKVS